MAGREARRSTVKGEGLALPSVAHRSVWRVPSCGAGRLPARPPTSPIECSSRYRDQLSLIPMRHETAHFGSLNEFCLSRDDAAA